MLTARSGTSRFVIIAVITSFAAVCVSAATVSAQAEPAPAQRRIRAEIAGGPALEVATPGDRPGERGVLGVPSISLRATSWLEYVVEAHAARYVTPDGGTVAGLVPFGWRIHGRGSTQPYLSLGAGVVWAGFTRLRGIDRRRNYLTHIGGGVRRARADGSSIFVEARLSHFSNLGSAPPNLGMEVVAVMVGYRFARMW
jgi:hypothetical protein